MSEENFENFGIFNENIGLLDNNKVFLNVKGIIKAFLSDIFSGFELIPDSGILVSENEFFELIKGYKIELGVSETEKNGLKIYEKEFNFYAGCRNISGAVCDYVIKKIHIKFYTEKQNKGKFYTITYIAGFTVIESPEIYKIIGRSKSVKH